MNAIHNVNVIYSSLLGSVSRAATSLYTPAGFEAVRPTRSGLVYRSGWRRGVRPRADVFVPERRLSAASSAPSVVIVHGGGFLIGSRRMKAVRFLTARLTERGIGVCALDYRMIFRGGRLDEALDDVVDGIAWWRRNAGQHGFSPDRISLIGISAGGALAVLAAADPRTPPLDRVVSVFGIYEFGYLTGTIGAVLPRWLLRTADRQQWHRRSPLHAPQASAPLMLVHGTADGLVPVAQVGRLEARRAQLGLATETLIFQDQPHAFLNWMGPAAERTAFEIAGFVTSGAAA